jgi:hypothetical protein
MTGDLAEELHHELGLIEDWLLHASDETLNELAEFVFGIGDHDHRRLQPFLDLLGIAVDHFRPDPWAQR